MSFSGGSIQKLRQARAITWWCEDTRSLVVNFVPLVTAPRHEDLNCSRLRFDGLDVYEPEMVSSNLLANGMLHCVQKTIRRRQRRCGSQENLQC